MPLEPFSHLPLLRSDFLFSLLLLLPLLSIHLRPWYKHDSSQTRTCQVNLIDWHGSRVKGTSVSITWFDIQPLARPPVLLFFVGCHSAQGPGVVFCFTCATWAKRWIAATDSHFPPHWGQLVSISSSLWAALACQLNCHDIPIDTYSLGAVQIKLTLWLRAEVELCPNMQLSPSELALFTLCCIRYMEPNNVTMVGHVQECWQLISSKKAKLFFSTNCSLQYGDSEQSIYHSTVASNAIPTTGWYVKNIKIVTDDRETLSALLGWAQIQIQTLSATGYGAQHCYAQDTNLLAEDNIAFSTMVKYHQSRHLHHHHHHCLYHRSIKYSSVSHKSPKLASHLTDCISLWWVSPNKAPIFAGDIHFGLCCQLAPLDDTVQQ